MIGGRYSLDREIGRGGMGAVWLGRDEVLGRPVAMKRMGLGLGGATPDLLRAEREAKIAASLNHPHIVGVFDLVDEDDHQWLVMEYVEGTTLAQLVRDNGALPPAQVRPIIAQAASALAAAHASGIVHRDVKPSNILVRDDGHVKLTDFGIARASSDASMTQTGLVTGSPAYLAPEVASGKQATAASDVWSLGATMYHALAGHAPYAVTDNVLGALYRIVNEPPPRLDDPGDLGPVLEATMAHDPAARWSAEEVEQSLDGTTAARSRPATVTPDPAEQTRAMTAAAPLAAAARRPPETPSAAPAAPTPGDRRAPARRRPVLPVLVSLLVVALVAVIVALALQDDPQPALDGANGGPATSSPTDGGTTSTDPSEPTSSAPAVPTEAELRSFVDSYLTTASSDPIAGYAQLTRAFQRQSKRYAEFWGSVSDPRLISFSADPEQLTVSYTYRYQRRGLGQQQDDVRLQLVRSGQTFLIGGSLT